MVEKHKKLNVLSKWSTKEIILFGRWFGYTPQSVYSTPNAAIKEEKEQNIREMVKTELIQEHLQTDVISFNTKLMNWIENVEENVMKGAMQPIDEQIINVDEDDDDQNERRISPLKVNRNSMEMPIQSGHNELLWINEICRRMKIRFEPEEIVEGKWLCSSDGHECKLFRFGFLEKKILFFYKEL